MTEFRRVVAPPTIGAIAVIVAFLTMGAAAVLAQSGASVMATIHGTVTDQTGGVLPGVTITLKSPAIQGQQLVTVTGADGTFRFSNLFNGVYTVSYTLSGFNTVERPSQQLPAGFVMKLDQMMRAGLSEMVEVTAAAPVVDATSTSSSYNLAATMIQDVPVGRGVWELINMVPGMTRAGSPDVGDSQLGVRPAASNYGVGGTATLAVEGVNSSIGGSSGVYQMGFSIDEVQVKTSGQTADTMSAGVNFQGVIKSGSNSLRGNYALSYEGPKLQSSNLTDALIAQGVTQPVKLTRYYDFGADLGGPVVRNKLWYYAAVAQQERVVIPLGFTKRDLSKTRGADGKFYMFDENVPATQAINIRTYTLKMSWQATEKNRILWVAQPTQKYEPQRGGTRTRSLPSTLDYLNPGWTHKIELQSSITPNTLLDINVGATGYFANYSTNRTPWGKPGNPSITDQTTNYSFGQGTGNNQTQNDRKSAAATLSFFPERGFRVLPGKHEMKIGFDFNRDRNGEGAENNASELGFAGNYTITTDSCQVDPANPNLWRFTLNATTGQQVPTCGDPQIATGQPFIMRRIVFRTSWPEIPQSLVETMSLFLTDTWRVGRRVTVNWGIRYDRQHPFVPAQGNGVNQSFPTLFPGGTFAKVDNIGLWNNVVPRLGVAWDVRGDGRTVIKSAFNIYTDRLPNGYSQDWNLNTTQTATFLFRDLNGNRDYDAGEVDLTLTQGSVVGKDYVSSTIVSAATLPVVNQSLELGYTREVTVSMERQIANNLAFRGQYVFKSNGNVQSTINPLRPFEIYNQEFTRQDPGADGLLNTPDDPTVNGAPRMVTFYDYDPAYRGAAFNGSKRINRDFNLPYYNTYELALTKRHSGKWSATSSVWWTQNHAYRNGIIATPNDLIFPIDNSWAWAANATGTYDLPYGVLLSGFYQGRSSQQRGARTYQFQQADPAGGRSLPSSNSITLPMEPANTQSPPAQHLFNMRLSKALKFSGKRLNLDLDWYNLTNSSLPTNISYASGPNYGRITGIVDSRIVRLGVRFGF